jgi:hypothetical protein
MNGAGKLFLGPSTLTEELRGDCTNLFATPSPPWVGTPRTG